MFKKIVNCIIAFIMLILLVGGIIQTCRLERYREQCEQYRVQLEAAANRERDIENTIQRTGLILCESINSVAELREQIKAVRESYEEMENIIYGSECGSISGSSNDNNNCN